MTAYSTRVGQWDQAEGQRPDRPGRANEAGQPLPLDAPTGWLDELVSDALAKTRPSRQHLVAVLRSTDDQLLDVVAAAARVRRAFFGNRVKLNYLVNMKSGLCPEDCSYCSQRRGSQAGVLKYNWVSPEEAAREADLAAERGARRICLVASGRGQASGTSSG